MRISRAQEARLQERFERIKLLSVDMAVWLSDICEMRGLELQRDGMLAIALAFGAGMGSVQKDGQEAMIMLSDVMKYGELMGEILSRARQARAGQGREGQDNG